MAKKLQVETGVDNPILRTVSKPVTQFDNNLKKFVKNMTIAMHSSKGIGIAAPQVGENIRIFLAALNDNIKRYEQKNGEIAPPAQEGFGDYPVTPPEGSLPN